MKAARIHDYGGPEVLVYEDAPDPSPGTGELLVGVAAVGVNPADWKFRNGSLAAHFPKSMPLILGMDVAGLVLKLGAGVTGFAPGDRVLAMIPYTQKGGYAQLVAAPADFFAPLPSGLDMATAAALPTPGVTAFELIEDDLGVLPGMRVMVTGATGGVGRAACYAASLRGAVVTAAVRASHRCDVRWADDILETDGVSAPGQTGYDRIADTIGGTVANGLACRLRPGGVLSSVSTVSVGDVGNPEVVARRFACYPDAARLGRLAAAVARGDLAMPPFCSMPLSAAAQAHRLAESGGGGKLVLIP